MNEIIKFRFSIEIKGGLWKTSPEYDTEEECWEAALRCKQHLNKRYQRITFFDERYAPTEEKAKKAAK